MSVYIDDMHRLPMGRLGRMSMSHMIADTEAELHAMAERIGLKREWFQSRSHPHYDVSLSKRTLALRHGAIEITVRQSAMMVMMRRRTGILPTPEMAEADHKAQMAAARAVSPMRLPDAEVAP